MMYLLPMTITTEPAPNPDPVDTGFMRAHYLIDDNPATCTIRLAFVTSEAPNPAACAVLATLLRPGWANPDLQGNMADACHLTDLVVGYSFGGGVEIEGHDVGDDPGLIGELPQPLNVAMVASLHTGERYRGGKGRIYFAGCPQPAASNGRTWSDGFIAAVQPGLDALLSLTNAVSTDHFTSVSACVRHQFRSGVALSPPVFTEIVGITMQPRVCTQRRRLGPTIS